MTPVIVGFIGATGFWLGIYAFFRFWNGPTITRREMDAAIARLVRPHLAKGSEQAAAAHDLARRIVSEVRSPGSDDEKVVHVALMIRGEK